jgi:hypothetical protein
MRQFYRDHTEEQFLAQLVRELTRQGKPAPQGENLSQLVRELVAAVPWGHHANALAKLSDPLSPALVSSGHCTPGLVPQCPLEPDQGRGIRTRGDGQKEP